MQFQDISVVGMHFRGEHAKEIVANFIPPVNLILEPEPDNQYDQMAVKVLYNNQHIGYIGRPDNSFIFLQLEDPDASYTCTVTHTEEKRNNLYPICTVTFD